MNEEEFEDPFLEATWSAVVNSENGDEALKILAFSAGVDPEEAVRRIAGGAPEDIVRGTLAGILVGMLKQGRGDTVMNIVTSMANFAVYGAGDENVE